MRKTIVLLAFLTAALAVPARLAGEPKPVLGGRTAAAADKTGADPSHQTASRTDLARPAGRKPEKVEHAVFAGGCFWCTELVFGQLKGVIDVESGYCGGTAATASYDKVHRGTTAHAESIRVTYDPSKISYEQLLDVFFDAHDPTQFNRQGEDDVGRQYRSAIFFADNEQKSAAEAKILELRKQRVYRRRIVTTLEPLQTFYPAEDFHQHFAWRNPFLPYIQAHAVPKACDVRSKHAELFRR